MSLPGQIDAVGATFRLNAPILQSSELIMLHSPWWDKLLEEEFVLEISGSKFIPRIVIDERRCLNQSPAVLQRR